MIAYIVGELTEIGEGRIVVETGGIGYLLVVPQGPKTPYLEIGEQIKVWTHMSVAQDGGITLYGMYSKEEQELFRMLITVSGIGPKGALGILSALSPDEIRFAIISEDDAAIARAPGIGKKTAQRIALELKEQISSDEVEGLSASVAGVVPSALQQNDPVTEAMIALQSLGYTQGEAMQALSAVKDKSDKPDELVRLALRGMM